MRLLLVLIGSVVLLLPLSRPSGLVAVVRPDCDLFEEALTLNCVSPLVSYASPSQTALHPALSEIDRHCRDYNSYLLCTAGVRPLCR